MNDIITEQSVFKPKPSRAETKADITDHAAWSIIDAEAERRDSKTARLRQARLENEEKLAGLAAPTKPRGVKSAGSRRARSSM